MRRLDRWPRVHQQQLIEPETDIPLDDFEETISADIESTRRGMKALTLSGHQEVEFRAMQNKLVDGLIQEVKELRHQLAKVVQSLNRKSSKAQLEEFSKSMREATDKRLDTIRNWAVLAIGAISIGLALLKR